MITPENAIQKVLLLHLFEDCWGDPDLNEALLKAGHDEYVYEAPENRCLADEAQAQLIHTVSESSDSQWVEDLYGALLLDGWFDDAMNDLRSNGVDTDLGGEYSRHYESRGKALQTPHGWVGYTYWHGGGKHGEPGAVPWMEHAYWLDCEEEEKLVTVRTFTKRAELQSEGTE